MSFGRELEVPLQRAGVGVERDHRVGVEVVAGPQVRVPVGAGVADAPVGQVERRVVRRRQPHRSAAGLPRVAAPRLVAALARPRHRVEAPQLLAGGGIERGDEAANAVLAAADADEDLVLHRERRHRDRVAQLRVADRNVPERPPTGGVDGHEMAVERAHEERRAEDGEPAVVGAAADARLGRRGVAVLPEHAPRLRVHGEHVVRTLRDVHDAVHHERRRLPGAERLVGEHPLELEVLHVAGVDLAQQRVTLAGVRPGVGQPVLRLVGRALQAIGGDLRECGRGRAEQRRSATSDRARARGIMAPSTKRESRRGPRSRRA